MFFLGGRIFRYYISHIMARVSTYINFKGKTAEAFNFYKEVFGTQFNYDLAILKDMPMQPGSPPIAEGGKDLVMHMSLPTLGDHELHGSDVPASMGINLISGSNASIMVHADTRAEADKLF